MHWQTLVKSIVEPILITSSLGKSLLLTCSMNLKKNGNIMIFTQKNNLIV